MPKPFPKEFREDVVRVARNRDPKTTLEEDINWGQPSASCRWTGSGCRSTIH